MVRRHRLLDDLERPLRQRLSFRVAALVAVKQREVIEHEKNSIAFCSALRFLDEERALEERLGLLGEILRQVEQGQSDELLGHTSMLGSPRLFTDGEAAPEHRLCFAETSL